MPSRSERARPAALFVLRNLLLYFLLLNAFLQLQGQLDLAFQSAAFAAAVCAGLWMERSRLRLFPALLLAAVLPFAFRAVFFLVFRLQRTIASAPATDFLFFYFDKDFTPALVSWALAWLFNFLALRKPGFVIIETAINSLLLVLVFWTQAGYRLTIYPHPSLFAWAVALFIIGEFFVILLAGSALRRGRSRRAAGAPTGAGGLPEAPPGRERVDARAVLSFAWILVPLLLVFLLFLLNRYGESSVMAGGGLMKPTLFRFDFAPYVRLESEIRTSDQTVLLFRTEGRAERFLLRRFVLSGYDQNQGFFMTRGKGFDEYPSTVPDAPQVFPDPGYKGRQAVTQEYYFLTLDPSSLISLNYPVRVSPLVNWKSSSFLRVYRVDSKVTRSAAGPRGVTAPPAMDPRDRAFYTAGADDPEMNALAQQITQGKSGYYAKVAAIDQYLRSNYFYSLKPGIAEDGNQLRHFLFVSRKGYSSYFAFAMALMCRGLGIPARVAVGFHVDPQSEVLNFYEVRAFQAHAWVEVWFGDQGWVEFDPTSTTPAPGEDFTPFTGPDRERMNTLIAEILQNQTDQVEQAPPPSPVLGTASRLGAALARAAQIAARLWYVTLPALYAVYLLLRKLLPFLPGLLSRNARRRSKAAWRRVQVRVAGVGLGRRMSESPLEHATRLEATEGIEMTAMADSFLKAAFGETFGNGDLETLRVARARFDASFRKRVTLPRRVLGALNPMAGSARSTR